MARLPRLVIPNQPHHLIQRGVDRQAIFRETEDYVNFLGRLRDASKQFKVAIHAYVLMSNHIHLLATPSDTEGLAKMMQWVGRFYVPYFNQKYERVGTLWQGRYRATVIDSERYFMLCSCYIDQNPVRAGIVATPGEYPWSSYLHHVGVKADPLVVDHALYWALGNTPFDREAAYRQMAEQALTSDQARQLADATNKGWALGSEKFKSNLEKQGNLRVRPARRGRPFKAQSDVADQPPGHK
ncbi:putative transposase [Collimonas sp. OK242]|uniref:transposase n=1 Tax=Collimonas sp. OK242 TaxID=1798195 RepID=UPI00089CCDC8|nr:transposase [Collimonas sp. OK242]SDY04689.1 putative transposase [Collimonas sp. OK242]